MGTERTATSQPYDGRGVEASYEHLEVSSQTLASSLEDGKIVELFYDRPDIVMFLRSYCCDVLGRNMQTVNTPNYDDEVIDFDASHTPNGVSYVDFFESALRETEQKPYLGKHIKGSLYELFAGRLKLLNDRLKAISPGLEAAHLHAFLYQPPEIQHSIVELDAAERILLIRLYKEKDTYLSPIGGQAFRADRDVVLEPGLLAKPPYIRSIDARACVSTCFRMVFAGVTGSLVNGHELQDPLYGNIPRPIKRWYK